MGKSFEPGRILVVIAGCAVLACFAVSSCSESPSLSDKLSLDGSIEAEEKYCRCEVPATVKDVLVQEGKRVSKGDLLIALDASKAKNEMRQADRGLEASKVAVSLARKRVAALDKEAADLRKKSDGMLFKMFGSKKKAAEKRATMKKQIVEARTALQTAIAHRDSIKESIEEGSEVIDSFNVKSPVDGIVSVISTRVGESVKPGQILVAVMDPTSIYFRSRIRGDKRDLLSRHQHGELKLNEKTLMVSIASTAEEPAYTPEHLDSDNDKLEYPVKIAIEGQKGTLLPGTRGKAIFKPGGSN